MSAIQWACLLGIAYYVRFLPAVARERPAYVTAGVQHGPGGSHRG
jgi:hypothetical protein